MRLEVFVDPFSGFLDGTDFDDTITGTGKSEFIKAGKEMIGFLVVMVPIELI